MGAKEIILIAVVSVMLVLIVIAFVITRRISHEEQYYDERWKIYNPEESESDKKTQRKKPS